MLSSGRVPRFRIWVFAGVSVCMVLFVLLFLKSGDVSATENNDFSPLHSTENDQNQKLVDWSVSNTDSPPRTAVFVVVDWASFAGFKADLVKWVQRANTLAKEKHAVFVSLYLSFPRNVVHEPVVSWLDNWKREHFQKEKASNIGLRVVSEGPMNGVQAFRKLFRKYTESHGKNGDMPEKIVIEFGVNEDGEGREEGESAKKRAIAEYDEVDTFVRDMDGVGVVLIQAQEEQHSRTSQVVFSASHANLWEKIIPESVSSMEKTLEWIGCVYPEGRIHHIGSQWERRTVPTSPSSACTREWERDRQVLREMIHSRGIFLTSGSSVPQEKWAVIVMDPWDKHWCPYLSKSVDLIAPKINEFLTKARKNGHEIIFAVHELPGGKYEDTEARKRMKSYSSFQRSKKPLSQGEKKVLMSDCPMSIDWGRPCGSASSAAVWSSIHPKIEMVNNRDGFSTNIREISGFLKDRDVQGVVYVGFHLNLCVTWTREVSSLQMREDGYQVAFMRELVDTDDRSEFNDPAHAKARDDVLEFLHSKFGAYVFSYGA